MDKEMTGRELIDYILRNKLEDHECLEDFEVVLKDGSWLLYSAFTNELIRHFPDPNGDNATEAPDFISEKEALKLRKEVGEMVS